MKSAYERRSQFDQPALDLMRKIEQINRQKHLGGDVQRKARIQVAIIDAMFELSEGRRK